MDAAKYPWMKFFPRDWLSDLDMRRCSISARGLWIDLICLMSQGSEYGKLVDGTGKAYSMLQIAMECRLTEPECAELMRELETARVFSKDDSGVVYSRRMVREHHRRVVNTKNGLAGGNPVLKEEVRSQKPDTRARLSDSLKRTIVDFIDTHPQSNPSLKRVWEEWIDVRVQKKSCKNWERMFAKQAKILAKHSASVAEQTITASIANDWQGLFPESFKSKKSGSVTQADLI